MNIERQPRYGGRTRVTPFAARCRPCTGMIRSCGQPGSARHQRGRPALNPDPLVAADGRPRHQARPRRQAAAREHRSREASAGAPKPRPERDPSDGRSREGDDRHEPPSSSPGPIVPGPHAARRHLCHRERLIRMMVGHRCEWPGRRVTLLCMAGLRGRRPEPGRSW